ncbi:MAG: hypothetical protein M1840_003827 [Geoglossum simile]|nr:MAG: hypothetical protein M1840_003827 [Geoglossum simile]
MSDAQSDFEDFNDVDHVDLQLSIIDKFGAKFRSDDDRPPPNAIVKETGILVRYGIVDKIHGKLPVSATNMHEDKAFCSIFVVDFKFDVIKPSRVIHHAYIDMVVSDPGREVRLVTPVQKVNLSKQSLEIEDNFGAGANVPIAGGGANANVSRRLKRDKVAYATVSGWPSQYPRHRTGPPNCGKWVIHENMLNEDGIPARLQVAILVLREDESEFELSVILNIKADWLTRVEDMFAETPPHLPIKINPKDASTGRVVKAYNTNDMSEAVRGLARVFKVSYGSLVDTFSDD